MTASPADLHHPGALVWANPARGQAFASWLASVAPAHQLEAASVRLAAADAGFRQYFRVDTRPGSDSASCIIMDAPPELENCQSFVHIAGLMAQAGINAPRVLAWDEAAGFMLLSDLGSRTMMDVVAPPTDLNVIAQPTAATQALYSQATDMLVQWQLASKPGVLPAYDDALLDRELALFPDWYVAKHRATALSDSQLCTLNDAFAHIKSSNLASLGGARVYVHRDFMPRNLMLNSEQIDQIGQIGQMDQMGVLDFQDAVYGPITYDIASLMRDAFLTWEEDFVLEITVRYWQKARKAGLPVGDDFGEFYRAVEWMGLQRHLKVLGIFARLSLRDGKSRYLADTPRFIQYARATCARYRQLGPLMVLLDAIEGNETRVGYTF